MATVGNTLDEIMAEGMVDAMIAVGTTVSGITTAIVRITGRHRLTVGAMVRPIIVITIIRIIRLLIGCRTAVVCK